MVRIVSWLIGPGNLRGTHATTDYQSLPFFGGDFDGSDPQKLGYASSFQNLQSMQRCKSY
jgi:hypothetical protein